MMLTFSWYMFNEKLTHKDKDKEKESISAQLPGLTGESQLELVDGFLISLQIVFFLTHDLLKITSLHIAYKFVQLVFSVFEPSPVSSIL